MAERVGFEPTEPLRALQFSRLAHSTTLPPLQVDRVGDAGYMMAISPRFKKNLYDETEGMLVGSLICGDLMNMNANLSPQRFKMAPAMVK